MRWQERREITGEVDTACLDGKTRRWHKVLEGVYEVTTDLGADTWQQCLTELTSCQSLGPNYYITEPDLGAKDVLVQGPACTKVESYFKSDEWLACVSEICANDATWVGNWSIPSVEWFRRYTEFASDWHFAPPRYINHHWHVDCLRTVVHGMMYVTANHDAKSTTLFRHEKQEVAITTGFDRGWILLQNGRQQHRGINDTQRPRYVFKWALSLKI